MLPLNILDIRTVILSYLVSNLICLVVVATLWRQNRRRFSGLGLWVADFLLQFVALGLVALRGIITEFLSMTVGHGLSLGGALLMYIGLERFSGKRGVQMHNYVLLALFIPIHAYFIRIDPSLTAHNLIFSFGLLLISSQSAWLMLRRAGGGGGAGTARVGIVFIAYCMVSILRITVTVLAPPVDSILYFLASDTLLLIIYQMLLISMTFSLFLLVNEHLFGELRKDVAEREKAEQTLQRQNAILAALQETTIELLSNMELDVLLEKIVKRAGLLMGTTAGYLDLVEAETGQLKPRVGLGALAGALEHEAKPGEGVAGTVWQTGKPLNIKDYDQWAGRMSSFSMGTIGAIIGVPLILGDNLVGVLGLAHDAASDAVFTEEDVALLSQFARLVTIGIENARLYDAAQRELAERKRANAILRLRLRLWEFSTTHTVEELMQKALDEIDEITGSPIGFYHFVEEDQDTLSLRAWSTRTLAEFCKAEGAGMHYPISEAGVWVDCVREGKAVIHNDYASLPHRKGMPEGHATVVRELVAPTLREGRVVSILGIGNKPTDYDQQDVDLVSYIADVIWSIIEQKKNEEYIRQLNSRLESLAMTDELTSLANRRAFFLRGGEEIQRVQRYQTPLSLILVDVDYLKHVNDTYGHAAGDRVLQEVANTLRVNIREIDLPARLGGDEFGILLPNTKISAAVILAGRLRLAIEKESYVVQNPMLRVTASVGVTEYCAEMEILDDVLRKADAALYQAKNRGRNRVAFLD
ncbi:MAG: diguanylate cyclase [Anaerolineales bacterium]|nr:diguanylate cyclase [Anaerolineales bacterium]